MSDDQTKNKTDEGEILLNEIGSLALESANLKYLTAASEEEQAEFVDFVEKNESDEDLLIKMLEIFPEFEKILTQEMKEIQEDLKLIEDL